MGTGPVSGIAYDPRIDGFYAVEALGKLFRIDRKTGFTTEIGPTGFLSLSALDFDSTTETLFATDFHTGQLLTINIDTGSGIAVGSHAPVDSMQGLAFVGTRLFGTDGQNDRLAELDEATGSSTIVGDYAARFISGLDYDARGGVLYATTSMSRTDPLGKLYVLDAISGESTLVGPIGWNSIRGVAFIVPEPSTGVLVSLVSILALLRYTKRSVQ